MGMTPITFATILLSRDKLQTRPHLRGGCCTRAQIPRGLGWSRWEPCLKLHISRAPVSDQSQRLPKLNCYDKEMVC